MVDFVVDPTKLALLNVDLQNIFVEGYPISAPEGPAVVDRVNRLAAVCRKADMLVVHTAHVTRADGSNVGVMGEIIPPTRHGLIAEGSHAAALHPGLQVEPNDVVLRKPRFGAFYGTDLELILRARQIDGVIICGIATNICAESTAREANSRDFRVFFMSDGTATRETEGVPAVELQRATCTSLAFAFAQVLTIDEMIAKIEAS